MSEKFVRAFSDEDLKTLRLGFKSIFKPYGDEFQRAYDHIDNLEKQLKLQQDIKLIFRGRIDKLEALKAKANDIINGPSCNCVDGQCNYCQNCHEYLEAAKELG